MTVVLPRIAAAMNCSTNPRVLQTLGMEGVGVALWERVLPERLAAQLDALPAEHLPRFRSRVATRQITGAVRAACEESGVGVCAEALASDIEDLAELATNVFASPLLELRLDVAEGQSCPRWHVDAVPARMLCTLRGPGTEYGPATPSGEPQSVHRMTRGAVGVFRGVLWPGRELAAIVHRSPPREAGGPRLLLAIDPVDDAGRC